MEKEQAPTFKSNNVVMLAADAALAAANEALKDCHDDYWIRNKAIKAALETALSSIVDI